MWAVMDIGTNSSRLLIAEYNCESRRIKPIKRVLRTTRIGLGMKAGKRSINPEAITRTLQALQEFASIIKQYPVKKLSLMATQAVREACNQEELATRIKAERGWDLQIISGEQEAIFSYVGALVGLETESLGASLVMDIGGGSTEFIINVAGKGNDSYQMQSIPLGALRLWENPCTNEQIQSLLAEELQGFILPESFSIVGVGGTVTTVAAVKLGLVNYDAERIQGFKLSLSEITALYHQLKDMQPEERLHVPGITKGREDIIIYGLQILINIMDYWKIAQITVSDHDLLYGVIINNN